MGKIIWQILFWFQHLTRLLLVLFLLLCQVLTLTFQPPLVLNDLATQRTYCELLAKDALLLEYQWATPDVRGQAISEMQDVLPLWEQEQKFLAKSKNGQVQLFMLQSQTHFVPLDTAIHVLLAHPHAPADPVQVTIILAHEQGYQHILGQLTTYSLGVVVSYDQQLFFCESITLILLLLTMGTDPLLRRKMQKEPPSPHSIK